MEIGQKDKRTITSSLMEVILLLCSSPVLYPALGFSTQERGGPDEVDPEESNRNDRRPGASLL